VVSSDRCFPATILSGHLHVAASPIGARADICGIRPPLRGRLSGLLPPDRRLVRRIDGDLIIGVHLKSGITATSAVKRH